MPVFNAISFVDDAIASILSQSYGDFEFVIVDDGSTDGTHRKLEQWANSDQRIQVVQSEHVGVTDALNLGLAKIHADYVARMDADDIALPERFARQVDFLDQHPSVVAVGSTLLVIDADGDILGIMPWHQTHTEIERALLRGRGGLPHPAAMIRHSAIRKIGGYRSEFRYAQDKDLWLRLSEQGKLANLPETLLLYREHEHKIGIARLREQQAAAEQAIRNAHQRRGIPFRCSPFPTSSQRNDHRYNWARRAYRNGYYKTARKHLHASWQTTPWSPRSWLLAAIIAAKSAFSKNSHKGVMCAPSMLKINAAR